MIKTILIADSGSTKTDWSLMRQGKQIATFQTSGINPFHQSAAEIAEILQPISCEPTHIYFYGAGCIGEKGLIVREVLINHFCTAEEVEVQSDMVGAARAVCGWKEGIVCILGTGSISCYYFGGAILNNISPLGYILGDEGSGAYLGKRLVRDVLKKRYTKHLSTAFMKWVGMTPEEIVDRVYRQPLPNRFLADCSRFIAEHRNHRHIQQLLRESFSEFIDCNLTTYPHVPLHFVGSIAYHYARELKAVAREKGFEVAVIMKSPMEGLEQYHSTLPKRI